MNDQAIKKYVSLRVRQLEAVGDLQPSEIETLVDNAIALGIADFWLAGDWLFKKKRYQIPIASQVESYELPQDFELIISAMERETMEGCQLTYYPPEEFWHSVPNVTSYTSGQPYAYTLFREDNKWRISFYHMPGATPIYLYYHTTPPNTAGNIPEKATGALLAVIEKYLATPGSTEYARTIPRVEYEIKRLEVMDSPYRGDDAFFRDDTDTMVYTWRPWI